jgi:hypothetical protein
MTATRVPLNPFERLLFKLALVLAGALIVARLGAILLVSYMHHVR